MSHWYYVGLLLISSLDKNDLHKIMLKNGQAELEHSPSHLHACFSVRETSFPPSFTKYCSRWHKQRVSKTHPLPSRSSQVVVQVLLVKESLHKETEEGFLRADCWVGFWRMKTSSPGGAVGTEHSGESYRRFSLALDWWQSCVTRGWVGGRS